MKNSRLLAAMLLLVAPVAMVGGCGGGGSSGPTTPTPLPTPTAGARVLVVQLRDPSGGPVEGIVSLGDAPVAGVSLAATSGGNVSFNRNIPTGSIKVSADVDGDVTLGTATVGATDTTVFKLVITPRVTPVPSATMPSPPF